MISLTTLNDTTPTMLDDGSGTYVSIAATTADVRVAIAGVTHTLQAGLSAAYETGGRALAAQATNGVTVVIHDGSQLGETGDYGPFPRWNAIRLMEPTEAWTARARMDWREPQTPDTFDQSMAYKREDAARRAEVEQSVREHNARMAAETQPVHNPWVKPQENRTTTIAEVQARLTAGPNELAQEDEPSSKPEEAALAGSSDW